MSVIKNMILIANNENFGSDYLKFLKTFKPKTRSNPDDKFYVRKFGFCDVEKLDATTN